MLYLLVLCQLTLAAVLLLAGGGKVLNATQFTTALRLGYVPKALITPMVVLTPTLELCLAAGLLLSPPHALPFVIAATAALLSLFTAWMGVVYMRGLRLTCGCFGTGGATIGPYTILRNVLLLAVALGGWILALRARSALPSSSLWMVVTVLSLGLAVMLLQAFQHSRAALVLFKAQLERAAQAATPPTPVSSGSPAEA